MELFKLVGNIIIDNTNAKKAIKETASEANDGEKKVSDAFTKIGGVASKIATGIGIAGAAIGGAFIATIESTREYRKEMGLLESAFLTADHSSNNAKNTYSELNAVLGDTGQAVEAAQHLALVADNEEELNELTHTLTGVYATFGASLPLEGLAEAINHSASLGEVQGSLADALEWSGITVDDFNVQLAECSSEEERQDLIMKTLKDTYSKAADQYKETNKDVMEAEKANEKLTDAFAELGAVGEPILTAIKNKVADMVAVAAPKLQEFIDKVKDGIKWVKENKDTIDKWVAVIIGATVAVGSFLLILSWGTIMNKAKAAIQIVTIAVKAFNLALKANPIGIVISLLAGLVAAFIYLWNNNEGFRKFWLDMWDKIRAKCGDAVDWIKNKFNKFKDMLSTVKQVFGGIKDTITEKIEGAKTAVDKAIKKIKGFFNIELKFKAIKVPKISISWAKGKGVLAKAAEILDLPGVPKFSVKWNASGAILTKPTLFGRVGNTFLGGGESGAEAIAPITLLQAYIRSSIAEENKSIYETLNRLYELISAYLPILANNKNIVLDSGALVGQLSPLIDKELGNIESRKLRGN